MSFARRHVSRAASAAREERDLTAGISRVIVRTGIPAPGVMVGSTDPACEVQGAAVVVAVEVNQIAVDREPVVRRRPRVVSDDAIRSNPTNVCLPVASAVVSLAAELPIDAALRVRSPSVRPNHCLPNTDDIAGMNCAGYAQGDVVPPVVCDSVDAIDVRAQRARDVQVAAG